MTKPKVRRLLCIGGPKNGEAITEAEGRALDYMRYNCSLRSTPRYGWPALTNAPSSVLVYLPGVERLR
jgi:hypothetical protein